MAKRGPGKFSTDLDAYAYEVTLDGGADEEESYGDGGGWYGLLRIDEDARNAVRDKCGVQLLNDEERDLLNESVAVILYERSDGLVETDWFDDAEHAAEVWSAIQAEFTNLEGVG